MTESTASSTLGATDEELKWALDIKNAALAAGIPGISDFEYLHHALVAKDNTEKALKRIQGLAEFRKSYDITSEDDPITLIKNTNEMFSGFLSAFGKDNNNRYVAFSVYKTFETKKLETEEDWKTFMGALYYMFQAMQADVESIRNGIILASDCSSIGWSNFSAQVENRAADIYQDAYPIRCKHIYMLDAPIILNILINIIKIFLSKKMKDIFQNMQAEKYYSSGDLPESMIPKEYGGESTVELDYELLDGQLKLRAKNEAEFQL